MVAIEKPLYILILLLIVAVAITGLALDGLSGAIQGFFLLQTTPARLIHDFVAVGGPGGALLNAAVVSAIALFLIWISDVRLSGPTIAAIFTIMGFSLFGKTPVNVIPVMFGTYLAGRLVGKPFKNYIMIALFGSALGPLVTSLVIEAGLHGPAAILVGTAGGIVAGFVLPGLAMAMLRLHEGYNLYNIGLTCGFFGLFAAAMLAAAGRDISVRIIWSRDSIPALIYLVPAISIVFAGFGLILDRGKALPGLRDIQKLTGRLPSDFMEMVSPGAALVNMGLLGLIGSGYVAFVKGDFNGPVLGGLLTLMGFGAFGKHLRNTAPVVAGVFTSTLLFGKSLNAPGPLLAFLFGTTLAPLAGEFGPFIGFAAGFLHLVLVERTAAWHGGLDLYNNGFAGGLTAAFLVALIEWYRSNKSKPVG